MSFQKGIVPLFITAALMYLCSVIYCRSCIEVVFTSELDRETEYQVFYTTEPGQRVNEVQSVKKKSSRGKHLERIILPIEKIVLFRFDFGVRPGRVSISDMALAGKNVQPLNFDDFSFVQIDSKRIEKNKLTIVSKQNDPLIIDRLVEIYFIIMCFRSRFKFSSCLFEKFENFRDF